MRKIKINKMDSLTVTPGISFTLPISGSFPIQTYLNTGFDLKINTDGTNFFLKDAQTDLVLFSSDTVKIPVTLSQSHYQIDVTPSVSEYLINQNTSWSMTMNFETMLASDSHPTIQVILNSENCFLPDDLLILFLRSWRASIVFFRLMQIPK